MYEWACETRVFKSEEEVKLIEQVVDIAKESHISCWQMMKPGMTEGQVSNYFYNQTRYQGNCMVPYENIVATGVNGSFLHYSADPKVTLKDGELCLMDCGARLHGYCSDLTRTVPVNGKFTPRQRDIYNSVLQAQADVFAMVKPGVSWQDCHIQAEKTVLKCLKELKCIDGDLEEMWKNRVAYYFFPHGLGHYLGLYVHDLPGLKEKENDWKDYDKMYLRVHRKLEKGMVLTNEPGIYFNSLLL